jgi:MFS family permease
MPDYKGDAPRPLDVVGLVLFGSGVALLSWLLEVFGEHRLDPTSAGVLVIVAVALLGAYAWHGRQVAHPLLRLSLFRIRTFRVAVMGGFVTRLGIGGLPFLLPLFYQLGLGRPAWQSGLLMMPTAAAAMGMKLFAARILARFGFRRVLVVNTVMIGLVMCLWALVTPSTPVAFIVLNGLAMGFFNSLQFSSMNTLAYADFGAGDASMASTIASSLQQLSMSFGLACGTLLAGWFLGDIAQSHQGAVTTALHHAFLTLGVLTMLSSLSFWTLRATDGESVSRGDRPKAPEVQASVHAGLHAEGNGAVPG